MTPENSLWDERTPNDLCLEEIKRLQDEVESLTAALAESHAEQGRLCAELELTADALDAEPAAAQDAVFLNGLVSILGATGIEPAR